MKDGGGPRGQTLCLWFALSAQPLTEVSCMVGTAHRVVKGENEQWEPGSVREIVEQVSLKAAWSL